MCINPPSTPATQPTTPTQISASNLQLGTNQQEKNQSAVIGRLALTSARGPSFSATAGQPGGNTTTSTPAGSLGLAPGANVAGDPITGVKSYTPFNTGYNR